MPADRCAECGFNFKEDKASLVARCGDFPEALKDVLESAANERIRARPVPEIWAPIEYAAHVGEALRWYAQRIRRVLDEDFPKLKPFDFDAAADAGEYRRRSVDMVLTDLRGACRELANIARPVSDLQLGRCGLGSDGSPRSVALLLARAHHEPVHTSWTCAAAWVRWRLVDANDRIALWDRQPSSDAAQPAQRRTSMASTAPRAAKRG